MAYRALDEKTLIDFLLKRPAIARRFARRADLSVKEIGDGNLNLVFIVTNRDDPCQAVIAKQALNYLRVAGESWPLTRERMRFESQAMQTYNRLCPGLVPEIYDYDEEMSLMVMEYLGRHEIMRKALVERRRFPKFVDQIHQLTGEQVESVGGCGGGGDKGGCRREDRNCADESRLHDTRGGPHSCGPSHGQHHAE